MLASPVIVAAGVLFARYREALVRLKELAIEEKQQQLAMRRANDVIDVMLKVERIKDPQLREKAKAAILAGGYIPPPKDDATESPVIAPTTPKLNRTQRASSVVTLPDDVPQSAA